MIDKFVICKQVVKAYKITNHEVVALRGIDFEMAPVNGSPSSAPAAQAKAH